MEIGNKDKSPFNKEERRNNERLKEELIDVFMSMHFFSGKHGMAKQYLPDSPFTVRWRERPNKKRVRRNKELVAVQTLRADSLVIPRDPDGDLDKSPKGSDFINIPSSFITENSYIVLLLPRYDPFLLKPEKVDVYDITVLKCVNNKQLIRYSPVLSPNLENIMTSDKTDSINIWRGNIVDRKRHGNYYKGAVNGTICYRMIEGTVEKKKQPKEKRAPNFVPQIASA